MKTKEISLFLIFIILFIAFIYHLFFTSTTVRVLIENDHIIKTSHGYEYVFYPYEVPIKYTIKVHKPFISGTVLELDVTLLEIRDWRVVGNDLE